jgi:hypothetical protein
MKELTIGCDPEAFLFDPIVGAFASSESLLGGSKERPRDIGFGAILEDNVTAEFNTIPVLHEEGPDAFVESVKKVRDFLSKTVQPYGYELRFVPEAELPLPLLETPQAMESGCDPDYNIYSAKQNEYPPLVTDTFRYAGGHVHIGHPRIVSNPNFVETIVTSLDISLTAGLLALHGIGKRANVYGALGNFRPKPYGLEYRSAPNIWAGDDKLTKFVHFCVGNAMEDAVHGRPDTNRANYVMRAIMEGRKQDLFEYMDRRAHKYGKQEGMW